VTRAQTRRQLLASGARAAAGGAAGASGASLLAPALARAQSQAESEADRLHRLLSLELLVLYCYEHVLASTVLSPTARPAIVPLLGHEHAHVDAIGARLRALGAAPPTPPASVAAANRDLIHRHVSERLGQLQGSGDALRLLLTIERVATGAYFVALIKLTDPRLLRLGAQIMASEAQHQAVIADLLDHGNGAQAAPYGLVQGIQ
jgi:Ferritin-like domain